MTLKTKIRGYGASKNDPALDAYVFERINQACEVLNVLKRLTQWAVLYLMEYLLEADDDAVYLNDYNPHWSYLEFLFEATHGSTQNNGGSLFFANMLRYLKNGKTDSELGIFKFCKATKGEDGKPLLSPFFLNSVEGYQNFNPSSICLAEAINNLAAF